MNTGKLADILTYNYVYMTTIKKEMCEMAKKPEIKAGQMRINPERRLKLEKAALEITIKTGAITTYTDVANILIDNYTEDAIQDAKK